MSTSIRQTKKPNVKRMTAATRKRRHEQKISRRETRKLCKAMTILSAMTKCYQMLNTIWTPLTKLQHIGKHIGLCKRKLPLHLSYLVKYQYISLAAVLGVVWLLTLQISFQATQTQAIKPTGKESSEVVQQNWTFTCCAQAQPCAAYATHHHAEFTRISYA